jgi:cytochrome c5
MFKLRSTSVFSIFSRVVLVAITLFVTQLAVAEVDESAIRERIAPAGSVCFEGEACVGKAPDTVKTSKSMSTAETTPAKSVPAVAPAVKVATTEPVKDAFNAEQVYNTKCMACHATGAAGAPKVGDAAAWTAKLEKGLDQVVANAVSGINAMPPKGMCMECSESDIRAIAEYMISKSK